MKETEIIQPDRIDKDSLTAVKINGLWEELDIQPLIFPCVSNKHRNFPSLANPHCANWGDMGSLSLISAFLSFHLLQQEHRTEASMRTAALQIFSRHPSANHWLFNSLFSCQKTCSIYPTQITHLVFLLYWPLCLCISSQQTQEFNENFFILVFNHCRPDSPFSTKGLWTPSTSISQ